MNVLLGVTGSVAAKLTPKLATLLAMEPNLRVKVVSTQAAGYFFKPSELKIEHYTDEDEWKGDEYSEESPVLHIELAKWTEMFVIAPLTANTLNKIVLGTCDNLLTCCFYAYKGPMIVAPAMNTLMWGNGITRHNISKLRCPVVGPVKKELACGDVGMGAMAHTDDIIKAIIDHNGTWSPIVHPWM